MLHQPMPTLIAAALLASLLTGCGAHDAHHDGAGGGTQAALPESDAGGQPAVSASGADPLHGTAWALRTIDGAAPPADTAASIEFQEGRVAGSTGCNRYSSSYELGDSGLSIGLAALTMMACPPPQTELEQQFTSALARVGGYRLTDEELVLVDADGAPILEFGPASPAPE